MPCVGPLFYRLSSRSIPSALVLLTTSAVRSRARGGGGSLMQPWGCSLGCLMPRSSPSRPAESPSGTTATVALVPGPEAATRGWLADGPRASLRAASLRDLWDLLRAGRCPECLTECLEAGP